MARSGEDEWLVGGAESWALRTSSKGLTASLADEARDLVAVAAWSDFRAVSSAGGFRLSVNAKAGAEGWARCPDFAVGEFVVGLAASSAGFAISTYDGGDGPFGNGRLYFADHECRSRKQVLLLPGTNMLPDFHASASVWSVRAAFIDGSADLYVGASPETLARVVMPSEVGKAIDGLTVVGADRLLVMGHSAAEGSTAFLISRQSPTVLARAVIGSGFVEMCGQDANAVALRQDLLRPGLPLSAMHLTVNGDALVVSNVEVPELPLEPVYDISCSGPEKVAVLTGQSFFVVNAKAESPLMTRAFGPLSASHWLEASCGSQIAIGLPRSGQRGAMLLTSDGSDSWRLSRVWADRLTGGLPASPQRATTSSTGSALVSDLTIRGSTPEEHHFVLEVFEADDWNSKGRLVWSRDAGRPGGLRAPTVSQILPGKGGTWIVLQIDQTCSLYDSVSHFDRVPCPPGLSALQQVVVDPLDHRHIVVQGLVKDSSGATSRVWQSKGGGGDWVQIAATGPSDSLSVRFLDERKVQTEVAIPNSTIINTFGASSGRALLRLNAGELTLENAATSKRVLGMGVLSVGVFRNKVVYVDRNAALHELVIE